MKRLLLIASFCYLTATALAQNSPKPQTIKGVVTDSATNKPLGYVTVAVRDVKTQQAIKGTLTQTNGRFELKYPGGKAVQLAFAFVGYKTKLVNINPAGDVADMGTILLSAARNQLQEVAITGVRPIVKQEIDRIGYDVQADPESKTLNVLEMLRKVPFVTVDANDNIQLKGNGNYKILINGKTSSLVARNPSDVFRIMPASSIQKIEVFTTPPAKYDAEGLGGIINIITNRKLIQGYNGSINVRENNINGPQGGVAFNIKRGKLGLSFNGGAARQVNRTTDQDNTLQTFSADPTNLVQSAKNITSGHSSFVTTEISYELDSLNLITGNINYTNNQSNLNNTQFSNLFNAEQNLAQSYRLTNNGSSHNKGTDVGLNYQLGFKRDRNQLLTISYKYSTSPNINDNNVFFNDRYNYNLPDYMQHNNAGTKEQTFQIDYVQPLKKVNIEAGLKAILRNSSSDFQTANLDSLNNTFVNDPSNSNNFNYDQNVYSFYNTYHLNLKDWGFKAGVRAERTTINADFVSEASGLNQDYTNIIPSISLQRKFKKNASITFGFTNRIQRPDIFELNPFIDKTNPKFITTGNPNLQPVLNHTFELNYSKFSRAFFNVGLSYSFANNTIQNVTRLVDTVTYTTYQNLGSDRKLGANINVNYPLTQKLNLSVNGQLYSVWLRGFLNGQLYNNQGVQGNAFAFAFYQFSKTYRAGVSVGFNSSNVLLQGKSNSNVFTSLGTSKDFLNKKATLYFHLNNIFTRYRSINSYTRDANFYQTNLTQIPYRSVGVGFTYRFGKLDSEIKKNKRGINNDDIKQKSKPTEGE